MRCKIITLAVALCALALPTTRLFAKELYVSPLGNDNNNGSVDLPFKTLAKGVSILAAGDTLVLKEGIYRETLKITASGSETQPIRVKAADNSNVVISGTEPLTGWSAHQNSISRVSVAGVNKVADETYFQLYHNGDLMDLARYPNDQDLNRFTIDTIELAQKGSGLSVSHADIPDVDLTYGYIWYLGSHSGTSWTRKITSSTNNSLNFVEVDTTKWPFNPHAPVHLREGNYGRFFVFGKLELLDYENEWFYDKSTDELYLQTANGLIPKDNEVEITARKHAIQLSGDNIRIEGIEVFGANVLIEGDNNQFINGKIVHGLQRMGELNNTDAQVSEGSITVSGKNSLIENNHIEHGSLNGIYIVGWGGKGKNTTIKNNVIRNFNTLGIHASLIRATGEAALITQNDMSYTGRDGVYLTGINSEFSYNEISQTAQINNDTGIFYVTGNQDDKNVVVHHNWFHSPARRSYHDQRVAGIYLDNNSKGYTVHHNVVWNLPWSGIQLNWENFNDFIYHNTILDVKRAMGEWVNGHVQQNNRVWNNYSNTPAWLTNPAYDIDSSLISTNQVKYEADKSINFMPNDDSELLDNGRLIDGLVHQYTGPAPDIGAYELQGTNWRPGVNAVLDDCTSCLSDPNADPVVKPAQAPAPEPSPEPTPNPEPTPEQPKEGATSSGGSMGYGLLVLFFGLFRKNRFR
ncbi:right-handed parallel beta-helix repeat-containing protein [Catenovulum maritimum]|uniref:Right handed beta helix domain-containing protein n=1 Tax=Catenovulum maritimum TaxID=1513271 RepID=A0A0J8H055_9ALTE|nr:right-handed parallel beta-helix repeat-containing protein [Catenovulum maritimum]KMT66864.1 hypothetical protein XM47_01775 [Catenovulum maritimum]